ncbi:DNA cytosine methyltransferase [Pararhizobium sp. DWP3-4]|uniref:DNA cytosine methyltransferase n=1 Tax=Pararhizobium sp. DWP3-4 TaxID=2804565 RepID=UPI003CF6806B
MAIKNTSPFKKTIIGKPRPKPARKKAVATDADSTIKDARWKILQNRRQLTKTLLDLVENVEKVLNLSGSGRRQAGSRMANEVATGIFNDDMSAKAVNSFLAETGLFPSDTRFFRGFSETLGAHKELLVKQAVQFDTIKAMISASDEARTEALARIAAGANLSPRQVREIEKEFQLLALSTDQRQSRAYDSKLSRGAITLGKKNAEEFRSAVGEFVRNFENLKRSQQLNLSQIEDLDNLSPAQVSDLERSDLARENLAREAEVLLSWFDKLFPDMCMPREDWLDLPSYSADLLLAKARYLLSHSSYGDFAAIDTEFSEFLELDGLDTLKRLCATPISTSPDKIQPSADANRAERNHLCATERPGKRTRAASSDLSETNPIRRFSAVEIFSASGAGALGLEAASFHVAAVSDENRVARATITANRPDWGVAGGMKSDDIEHAIPSGMKARGVDVICGALPGRPWHRKSKGATDEGHAFPEVISLIRQKRPNGFFFENAEEFLDARHALYKNWIIQEFSALGYIAEFFLLKGEEYGLAQNRNRTVIMGVKRSLKKDLVPPLIEPGVYRSLVETLEDLVDSQETSDNFKSAYITWRNISQKRPVLTPDLYSLVKPYSAVLQKWRDVGFEFEDVLLPQIKRRARKDKPPSIPLTTPVLKALQGIPPHWVFEGSEWEQAQQICRTTPPAITRLVAQAMHATLTGQLVDLSASFQEPIAVKQLLVSRDTGELVPTRGFKKQIPYSRQPIYLYDNPQAEKSRRYRVEQEIHNGPT